VATKSTLTVSEDEFLSDLPAYPGDLTPYWHPVALGTDVTRQPMRVVLLDRPIVLFRDDLGVVGFRDLCVHRGTALSLGTVTEEGNLRCPYHGWQYDRTGACVRIPARPEGSPIPRTARALKYHVQEAYGLVWVCIGEPASPIPPFPGGEFDDPEWRTFFAFSEEWDTSAGRILENFCDWTHLPFVHDGVLGTPALAQVTPSEVTESDDDDGYSIRYSYDQIDQSEIYGGGGQRSIRRDFVVYLPFFANLYKTLPTGERNLLTMALCPHSARRTTLYLWISRDHDFERPDEEYREFSRVVFAQDKRVVETQRPEQIPTDLKAELHLKVPDAFSVEFRQLFNRIAEGPTTREERA
jgi:phenylpropionate dioxygenase-like ring-hydroxylating dioxygenase large terminal subunit